MPSSEINAIISDFIGKMYKQLIPQELIKLCISYYVVKENLKLNHNYHRQNDWISVASEQQDLSIICKLASKQGKEPTKRIHCFFIIHIMQHNPLYQSSGQVFKNMVTKWKLVISFNNHWYDLDLDGADKKNEGTLSFAVNDVQTGIARDGVSCWI